MQTKFGVFGSFSSLFSRKFDEISLSSWQNFASTEAKFRHSENWHTQNFARAKFPQTEISLAMETGCNDWIVVFAIHVHVIAQGEVFKIERSSILVIVKPKKWNENESFHTPLSLHFHIFKRRK